MDAVTQVAPDGTPLATSAGIIVAGIGASGSATEAALLLLFQNGTAQVSIRRLEAKEDTTRTVPGQAGTATLASVAASIISVTLAAASAAVVGTSPGRMGMVVVNDSTTATLYLAYAATASLTAYTYKVLPGQTFEMPSPLYSGLVSGIWDVASGNARVTTLTT
jgi:hypothetical protein